MIFRYSIVKSWTWIIILALSEELIFISRKVTIWWQFFGRGSYGTATNNGGETKRLWDGSRRRKEGDVWSGTCQSAKLSVSVICHTNNSSASGPYTTSPPLWPILPLQLPPSSLFLLPIPIILISNWFHSRFWHCVLTESIFADNRIFEVFPWKVFQCGAGVSENGGRCVSFETAPPFLQKASTVINAAHSSNSSDTVQQSKHTLAL